MLPESLRRVWIPNNAQAAIDRACQLIEELGAGEVVGGMVDVYHGEKRAGAAFRLSRNSINALLGTDISEEQMLAYFKKIDLGYDDEKTNEVIAPTFRQDLFRTADLAEEVARFYGYDNIPTTLPKGEATTGKLPFELRIEADRKRHRRVLRFLPGHDLLLREPEGI